MENTTLTTKRKINFFQLENELVDDGHLVQLKGSPFAVYVMLCRYTNNSTSIVFPSYTTIQRLTGLDRKTAMKAISTLEDLGYIIKVKKGGKDAGSNHYEIQELKSVNVSGKKKRNIKPPVATAPKKSPKKERTDIEAIEISESVIEEAAETDAYKAYKAAIEVWSVHTGAKPWKLDTFTKKTSKHNQEALTVAYSILKNDTANIFRDTAKVYLISPDDMMTQLYPRIKSVIANKTVEAARKAFQELVPVIKVKAIEEGIVTQEEADWIKENKHHKYSAQFQDINSKYVKYWHSFGPEIAEKYGVKFSHGDFYKG